MGKGLTLTNTRIPVNERRARLRRAMGDETLHTGRRRAIQHLAIGAGGLLLFPLVASGHPVQHHLRDETALGLAGARADSPDYVPEFLDVHQLDMLRILAERIVPGSTTANSAAFIDQLLSVSTAGDQRNFLQALGAFEGLAIARAQAPWKNLGEQQQIELLTLASTAVAGRSDEVTGPSAAAHVTIRDHFEHLKGWIAGAYYSSEAGMRELGWTGGVAFGGLPACE
jgi:hypothetical protein